VSPTGASPPITSWTSICRLRPDVAVDHARQVLADLPEDAHSPFAASARTHFGRILVIDELMVHRRRPLAVPVVLLSADFDGDDTGRYLLELLGDPAAAGLLATVLALCDGGPADPTRASFVDAATAYLLERAIRIGLQYVDDPRHRSAADIRRAVAHHRRLVGFVAAHQGDAPAELHRAFLRTFPGAPSAPADPTSTATAPTGNSVAATSAAIAPTEAAR
jgi:hypothetical protein